MVRPPGPVAPNVAQIDMKYLDITGKRVQNTFHAHKVAGWDATDLMNLASGIAAWYDLHVVPIVSDSLTLSQIVCTDLTSLDNSRFVLNVTTPGSDTTGQVPNNVTLAVKADIGKRGRGRNGRIFIPGLSVDQVTLDNIKPAVALAWIDALDELIVVVSTLAGSPQLVVLHKVVAGVKLAIQTFDAIVNWGITDEGLDTQKNRLVAHKRRNKEETP